MPGAPAGLRRRSEYLVLGIVIRSKGILADVPVRKLLRSAHVFRDRRTGDAEIVERHVAFALVMPFRIAGICQTVVFAVGALLKPRVFAVDDSLVADTGRGVPCG